MARNRIVRNGRNAEALKQIANAAMLKDSGSEYVRKMLCDWYPNSVLVHNEPPIHDGRYLPGESILEGIVTMLHVNEAAADKCQQAHFHISVVYQVEVDGSFTRSEPVVRTLKGEEAVELAKVWGLTWC